MGGEHPILTLDDLLQQTRLGPLYTTGAHPASAPTFTPVYHTYEDNRQGNASLDTPSPAQPIDVARGRKTPSLTRPQQNSVTTPAPNAHNKHRGAAYHKTEPPPRDETP